MTIKSWLVVWLLIVAAMTGGCGTPESTADYHANPITGLMPDLSFELVDENNRATTAEPYRGDFVILFFGYTHCPMICPATMGRLHAMIDTLPQPLTARLRVLFVSVDPERDPPERLAEWTDHFGSRFIGLTGTTDQLDTLTRRYRTTYSYGQPNASGFYIVNHSSGLFIFDPAGRARLLATQGWTIDGLADDLKTLARRFDNPP